MVMGEGREIGLMGMGWRKRRRLGIQRRGTEVIVRGRCVAVGEWDGDEVRGALMLLGCRLHILGWV